MRKIWLAAGLAVAAMAGLGALVQTGKINLPGLAQAKSDGKKPDVPLEFSPREVTQPAWASLPTQIEFSGALVAPDTVVLRSKVAGALHSLSVAEGSRVKAGQVVGRVDVAEVTSRVAERQAMVESAAAQLAQAERTLASNQRLADQQFISSIALENSRAAVDTAKAQANAARASLITTQVGLREAALVAPISGIVAKRQALAGEKVSMEQPLLTIVNLSRLELIGNVATHDVSRLAPGMAVQVHVEGHDNAVAARITRIAPAAETGTRSIAVTIAVRNADERFRAGQYALAKVELADVKQRLTIPSGAVQVNGGENQVWLIENGKLERRTVMLGRQDPRGARVEVLQGLSPGAQLLAARFESLREGAQASVVAARAAPVASASSPALSR